MVNEYYEPSDTESKIVDALKDGRDADMPWGRANPLYFRKELELKKSRVEHALSNLEAAGWIRHLNDGGLYEFVADPREKSSE